MTPEAFQALISPLTARLHGLPVDAALEEQLNREWPAEGETVRSIATACQAAIAAGWMCRNENDGIRWGRVIRAGEATHGFSVDVVDMNDVIGPHHEHPQGEIDLVMPIDDAARFDGRGAGWKVYGPGSAHRPTVSGGRALVMYLLPQGAIRFTGQ